MISLRKGVLTYQQQITHFCSRAKWVKMWGITQNAFGAKWVKEDFLKVSLQDAIAVLGVIFGDDFF